MTTKWPEYLLLRLADDGYDAATYTALAGREFSNLANHWRAVGRGDYDDAAIAAELELAIDGGTGELAESRRETPDLDTLTGEARHSADFRSVRWFGTNYEFTPNQAAVRAALESVETGDTGCWQQDGSERCRRSGRCEAARRVQRQRSNALRMGHYDRRRQNQGHTSTERAGG